MPDDIVHLSADARLVRAPHVPETLDTRDLFGAARELMIHHEGALYRLRITRNQKLILTK
jgi:hemin uptake protein HemP